MNGLQIIGTSGFWIAAIIKVKMFFDRGSATQGKWSLQYPNTSADKKISQYKYEVNEYSQVFDYALFIGKLERPMYQVSNL